MDPLGMFYSSRFIFLMFLFVLTPMCMGAVKNPRTSMKIFEGGMILATLIILQLIGVGVWTALL